MNTKKQKQKKKKCGISGENFSRHPHFREKEFVFFGPINKIFSKTVFTKKR